MVVLLSACSEAPPPAAKRLNLKLAPSDAGREHQYSAALKSRT